MKIRSAIVRCRWCKRELDGFACGIYRRITLRIPCDCRAQYSQSSEWKRALRAKRGEPPEPMRWFS